MDKPNKIIKSVSSSQRIKPQHNSMRELEEPDRSQEKPPFCKIFTSNYNTNSTKDKACCNFFDSLYTQYDSINSLAFCVDETCEEIYDENKLYRLEIHVIEKTNFGGKHICDAWIPSQRIKNALIAVATTSEKYCIDRDLYTMPGTSLDKDLDDSVGQLVEQTLGQAEAMQRKVLTVNDVTQDECGLQELISGEYYRAAINLTGRLLSGHEQGLGKVGILSKHTDQSIQLWFVRLTLLVKLQMFTIADTEASPWYGCDKLDLYYQFYPELYGKRVGTLIPFQMRLLLANVPSYCDRHKESLEQLFFILATVRKVLQNVESGRSEDGCNAKLDPIYRTNFLNLWKARENRVLVSVVNVALSMKDFCLAVKVIDNLILNQNSVVVKRKLNSTLGRIYLQLGDIESCEKCFKDAHICKQTVDTNKSKVLSFQDLVDQGLLAMAQNNFEHAYRYFENASFLDPSSVMVMNNCAICLMYMGHLKEAIRLLTGAIGNNPKQALHDNLINNLCALYELETSYHVRKKLEVLKMVSMYKADSVKVSSFKLFTGKSNA